MRMRTVSLPVSLSALLLAGLTACSGGTPQSPPGPSEASDAAGMEVGDVAGNETHAATSSQPPAVDIRTVDLGATTWLYSYGGTDLPVTLQFVDGAAAADGDGFPISYTLGEVSYGDIDADGDDDAVATVSRAQDNGYEALWYLWLADGGDLVQVKYPIARTGKCGTHVESVVIDDGAVTVTEYLRIPGLDDNIPCSNQGTGLKKRTITVQAEGPEAWPVQTAPVAAWGGLCPGPRWPDTAPGLVDLWAAPSQNATMAAAATPDGGAMFEQNDAALMQREGWALIGFRLFGVESDLGGTDMACAWALN